MTAIDAIIVGAGSRGLAYGRFARDFPQELKVVGLAEPDPIRRARFLSEHDIAPDMVFDDWQSLLGEGRKLAPTINQLHDGPPALRVDDADAGPGL